MLNNKQESGCNCIFLFSSRRRHTRYIGDWSSDVCSSDLSYGIPSTPYEEMAKPFAYFDEWSGDRALKVGGRSEERRVGKECRSRGLRYREKTTGSAIAIKTQHIAM